MNSERQLHRCRKWLMKKYVDEEMTLQQIANICDIHHVSILYWFKKFNIPRRHSWKNDNRKLCFYFPSFLLDKLEKQKRQSGDSISEIIRKATLEYMAKRG